MANCKFTHCKRRFRPLLSFIGVSMHQKRKGCLIFYTANLFMGTSKTSNFFVRLRSSNPHARTVHCGFQNFDCLELFVFRGARSGLLEMPLCILFYHLQNYNTFSITNRLYKTHLNILFYARDGSRGGSVYPITQKVYC